jgi:transcription factor MYB, plant
MARAPSGARLRAAGGSRVTASGSSGQAVRKGTWMAEEDAVLLEHVRVHGPSNWSSIRSKGLLPRTGKSCRLRWVNKLRPNLKS